MPPPRRPPARQRVASISVAPDPELLAKTKRQRVPASVDDPALSEGIKLAIKHIDECLEVLDGYEMSGVVRRTVKEVVGPDVPAWDCDFLNEVFRYIIERPVKDKAGRLAQDTFRNYGKCVLAAGVKIAHNIMAKAERKRVVRLLEDLVKEYDLSIIGYDRAQIGYGTLNALLAALPMAGLGWERSMSLLLFQAIQAYCGTRPDQLVRIRSIQILKRPSYNSRRQGGDGARLRDFHLWWRRTRPGEPPKIYGWFTPRGGKTRQSRGLSFSLSPVSVVGFDPALLVFMYACHKGVCGGGGIEKLFKGMGGDINWPEEYLDLPLFPSDKHPGHNVLSSSITRTIHHLCDIQGIDGIVDCRCYRSLSAAYVYEKHGAELASLWLSHTFNNPRVTRRYIGRAAPIDIQKAIFRDEGSNISALEVNSRNAKPRIGAPRTVDPEDLQKILQDSKLQKIIDEQEAIKLQIAAQGSSPSEDLRKRRKVLSTQWWIHFDNLLKHGLSDKRVTYMDDLAAGVISTDNAEEADIISLERILVAAADIASRPDYSLVDAPSIVMPDDTAELALIEALFSDPENITSAYELLSPSGVLSKRKPKANGPVAMRRLAEEDKADKEICGEDVNDELI